MEGQEWGVEGALRADLDSLKGQPMCERRIGMSSRTFRFVFGPGSDPMGHRRRERRKRKESRTSFAGGRGGRRWRLGER